jgi:hypothetical protein
MWNRFLLAACVAFSSTAALAAFSPDRLIDANKAALEVFKKGFSNMNASDITGFKSWKSGDDAKVAVYMDMDGSPMETDYDCTDNNGKLDCQVTQ